MHDYAINVDSINDYFWDYFVFVPCSFCYNSLNFEKATIKLQKIVKSKEIRKRRSQRRKGEQGHLGSV
jgi:hypothetical protein